MLFRSQNHGISNVLDHKLIESAKPALENRRPVIIKIPIKNINRTTGAMLSGEICRRFGEEGFSHDTVVCKFRGVAGQSFGAWLAKGVTFELEGLANDYIGKGISGGKIIIFPDRKVSYVSDENIIVGNTCFYGAIAGEAYIAGIAGERFCIRNSGLYAVIEGIGDHGCEYMTGGRVVVIGKTGRNFAAGMSGGIAYIYDSCKNLKDKCNREMVELEKLGPEDEQTVNSLLRNHYRYTHSRRAEKILANFNVELKKFVKVMPLEYKRILKAKKMEEKFILIEIPISLKLS